MNKILNQKFFKNIKKYRKKNIVFFGASIFLEQFLKEYSLEDFNIKGIVDSNQQRWGEKIGCFEIISLDKINELGVDCVIISILNLDNDKYFQIENMIKKKHPKVFIPKNKIFKHRHTLAISRFKYLILLLDKFIPKKKDKCVFISYPDFSDNAKEYYEYLKYNHSDKFELIWLYENPSNEEYKFINNKYHIASIRAIWHVLTSKYLIFTHTNSFLECISLKKHILIALWHGMPLKTLGYLENNISNTLKKQYKILGDYGHFFVTSDIFKLSMQSCFMMDSNRVHITGQPRTDCILSNRNETRITDFLNLKQYKNVILYTPTYKEVIKNNKRDVEKVFNNIFYIDDYLENEFYRMLEEKNILFLIKPHPLDEVFYKKYYEKGNLQHSNVKILFNDDMIKNNFYFYDFFKFADLMITDFSSIGIDFLISKKPVIYLTQISNDYSRNRGFILQDNYEIFMLGEKVRAYKELVDAIEDALTVDTWKDKRAEMLPYLHKYIDSSSSERIFNIMKTL